MDMTFQPAEPAAPGANTSAGVFGDIGLFEHWDRDYYHPAALPFYDLAIRRMLSALACPAGGTILDAGCGPGEHSIRVAQAGHDVVALDLSEAALQEGRRRAKRAGVEERIRFQQGDLTRLDFADHSFPAVFCWGVLIHIPQIEQALEEMVRILQPGGRLALYVTNQAALDHFVLQAARRVLGKPPARYESGALGRGRWHVTGEDRLWVWHVNVPALTAHLSTRGMVRVARMPGELTETQRRVGGPLRRGLLWMNRAYSRLNLPAQPCADNLLVFEKRA